MRRFQMFFSTIIIACIAVCGISRAADTQAKRTALPFFAFGNGTGGFKVPFDQQAKMLKELGYDGIALDGIQRIPEMRKALDAQGLKMLSVYATVNVAPAAKKSPYPPKLKTAIAQLKGSGAQVWLTVGGPTPSNAEYDAKAVAIFRDIADMAEESGLQVALYPHFGSYIATIDDALRLAKKTDRKNLGMCFNLCHFLKSEDQNKLEEQLLTAMSHLYAVNINGADAGDTRTFGWNRLIQPLDRGDFDVSRVLKTLKGLNYNGPIGLQCYAIPGDPRDNLSRSMKAWQNLSRKAALKSDTERASPAN
jgi:sugar phosphate isomerase/epimerase